MKLFLASLTQNVLDKLVEILPKPVAKVRVAFISTAADVYEDKKFVDEDRNGWEKKGFSLQEVDLKGKDENSLFTELKEFDVIYVSGGNSFYLLEQALKSGFDKALRRLFEEGIIYAGGSAGSVLVGKSLEPVQLLDDPLKAKINSFEGLQLVDFVVLPHYGKEKYRERYENIMQAYSKKFTLVPITDEQAIIVTDEAYEIV